MCDVMTLEKSRGARAHLGGAKRPLPPSPLNVVLHVKCKVTLYISIAEKRSKFSVYLHNGWTITSLDSHNLALIGTAQLYDYSKDIQAAVLNVIRGDTVYI